VKVFIRFLDKRNDDLILNISGLSLLHRYG